MWYYKTKIDPQEPKATLEMSQFFEQILFLIFNTYLYQALESAEIICYDYF